MLVVDFHYFSLAELLRLTALQELASQEVEEQGARWSCRQCKLPNKEDKLKCVACYSNRYPVRNNRVRQSMADFLLGRAGQFVWCVCWFFTDVVYQSSIL